MFHCHPCIFPCVFLNLWSQEQVRTWRKEEFWSNLARFGSRNGILTKWHNDSASFLLEKLKKHIIFIKNSNILSKFPKIFQKSKITKKQLRFPRDPCGDPCGGPLYNTFFGTDPCQEIQISVEVLLNRWVPQGSTGLHRATGLHRVTGNPRKT